MFVFVERSVYAEYSTYQLNKGTPGIRYSFVDNVKVYEFIEELHKLPKNNPITTFETSVEILEYLRVQWAGLFQRFLQQQTRVSELNLIEDLSATAKTLRELVTFLTEERSSKDDAIRSILLANHPAFRRFAELTETLYRVYFTNRKELNTWLKARSWKALPETEWDEGSFGKWTHDKNGVMNLTVELFDDKGRLQTISEDDWRPEWITISPSAEEEPQSAASS